MSQTHETDTCEVLVVRNLNVAFRQQDAPEVQAVRQLSFSLRRGETLAIVGESGSGKSVTALALMRLLDAASSEVNSEGLWLRRRNRQVIALNEQTDAEMRRVRGADLAMIFQEPMTSLNPVFTIGEQIAESLRLHQGLGREEALRAAKKMLDQVRIPQAEEMLSRYPHQLSGGMRQRVMIAMALSVLIADEPTTVLDVTIQAQILQLIAVLQKEMAMGVIFITHDMGVVADIADRVLVMYRGEAVETGSVEEIFRSPQHPYTQSLLAAVPRLGEMRGQDLPRRFPLPGQPLAESETPDTVVAGEPILQVRDLVARFPVRGGLLNRVTREVHAVEKVSFDLWPGETLSLVGESGSGKSTTGRALLRLGTEEQQLSAAQVFCRRRMNVAAAEAYIEDLLHRQQVTPPKGRTTYIIKDVRLFLNSVDRGLHLMRQAGVNADWGRQDTDEEILLTIRIPKRVRT